MADVSSGPATAVRRRRGGAPLVLAVVLAGSFIAVLDVAIVNVAIPAIRSDLHVGFGAVELVISAYTLTCACPLVTGGRLGDLYGRRRSIGRRQAAGLIDPGLDPRPVRLYGFALGGYPSLLPQITRMTYGTAPHDPTFVSDWAAFLRRLGGLLDDKDNRCDTRS